ncbi:Cell wall protein RBR3 [Candida tropicalis]
MLYLLFGAFLFFQLVVSMDITQNTVVRGINKIDYGDTAIFSNFYLSIFDVKEFSIDGSLEVQTNAGFYITQTSSSTPLDILVSSDTGIVKNNGIISFNSQASSEKSSHHFLVQKFTNNGELFLSDSGIGDTFMNIDAQDFDNENLIVFYQKQRTSGLAFFGDRGGIKNNNGNVCVFNNIFQVKYGIDGSGCITAQENSLLYFPGNHEFSENQSLYLVDGESAIISSFSTPPKNFNVYGFGNGNTIGGVVPLNGVGLPPFEYNSTTGILTLRFALVSQTFHIGQGYDPDLFEVVTNKGGVILYENNSVKYTGPVPKRDLPAACQIQCKVPPEAPGNEPTQFTTEITTTACDGSDITATGVVDITTDGEGSWFTTTSFISFDDICSNESSSTSKISTSDHTSSSIKSSSSSEVVTSSEFSSTTPTSAESSSSESTSESLSTESSFSEIESTEVTSSVEDSTTSQSLFTSSQEQSSVEEQSSSLSIEVSSISEVSTSAELSSSELPSESQSTVSVSFESSSSEFSSTETSSASEKLSPSETKSIEESSTLEESSSLSIQEQSSSSPSSSSIELSSSIEVSSPSIEPSSGKESSEITVVEPSSSELTLSSVLSSIEVSTSIEILSSSKEELSSIEESSTVTVSSSAEITSTMEVPSSIEESSKFKSSSGQTVISSPTKEPTSEVKPTLQSSSESIQVASTEPTPNESQAVTKSVIKIEYTTACTVTNTMGTTKTICAIISETDTLYTTLTTFTQSNVPVTFTGTGPETINAVSTKSVGTTVTTIQGETRVQTETGEVTFTKGLTIPTSKKTTGAQTETVTITGNIQTAGQHLTTKVESAGGAQLSGEEHQSTNEVKPTTTSGKTTVVSIVKQSTTSTLALSTGGVQTGGERKSTLIQTSQTTVAAQTVEHASKAGGEGEVHTSTGTLLQQQTTVTSAIISGSSLFATPTVTIVENSSYIIKIPLISLVIVFFVWFI